MSRLSAISALTQKLPLRVEDAVLAGWVAVASPLLFKFGGGKGPFDPDQPLEGTIRLGAVVGVLVCLAARQVVDRSTPQTTLISRGAMGPFVGGILLIIIAGFAALDASSPVVLAALVVTAIVLVIVRIVLPPLAAPVRRALVAPYAVVAAGLYWTVIESVVAPTRAQVAQLGASLASHSVQVALLFLIAFSAVYYAMLIFAPRQIAEREGGAVEWLVRYAAFVVSVVFGIGWLSAVE